jgi:hypothetical protein
MSNYFKNVDLSGHSLDVGLILDFVLLEDLNGHLLPGEDVGAEADLAKGALPQGPTFALGYYSQL